jgi:predicted NBD/HSP70 family sugar kinase
MLFLGFGTGLGTALVDDGRLVALELAHLPYRGETFEDVLGQRGLRRGCLRSSAACAADRIRASSAGEGSPCGPKCAVSFASSRSSGVKGSGE